MLKMKVDNLHFQEPYQETLFEKLYQVVGDGPALMYRDACWLMSGGRQFASAACLVAHLLREINGAIVDSMLPVEWQPEKCPECKQNRDGIYQAKIDTILGMQGYAWPDAGQMKMLWISLRNLHRHAHKDSLSPPRPLDQDFEELFRQAESAFRAAIDTLEASFPTVQQKLNQLLSLKAPGVKDATTLRTGIPNSPVILRNFFDRAGYEWLDPLRVKHFFDHPPQTYHDQDRGLVYQPAWPQSVYLKRMAATDRALTVCEIIKNLRHTNNARIIDDFGEALLAMPVEIAVELVNDATEWLRAGALIHLTETLGQVITKLVAGGKPMPAVELAHALLAVPDGVNAQGATKTCEFSDHFDQYHYTKILEEHIPALVTHAGMPALEMLCDLLDTVLRRTYPERAVEGDFEDSSDIWHGRIEGDGDSFSSDLKTLLTVALRRAAEHLLLENGVPVADLVCVLESRKWGVFRRIALYVLRLSQQPALDLVATRLADRGLFDDPYILHFGMGRDYGMLLERWYHILPVSQKTKILSWIEQGPDVDEYRTNYKQDHGRLPSKATVNSYVERWQLRRLSLIKDDIPQDWRKRYEMLDRKHHQEESGTVSTAPWVRPRPPLTADVMKAMDVKDLVEEMELWTPARPFERHDDIAHELTIAVAAEPKRFSAAAEEFHRLSPLYMRALLRGLYSAVDHGQAVRWRSVFKLCKSILDGALLDADPVDKEAKRESDWTRQSIVELVRAGLKGGEGSLPANLRPAVWSLIKQLADQPDLPDEGWKNREMSVENLQYAILSSVRAQALWAAIEYGVWLKNRCARKCPGTGVSLEAMPEVRHLLDRHLDQQQEQSVVVHSVYGLLLSHLLWLDENWMAEHVDEIFPTGLQHGSLFSAAWRLYVGGTDPGDRVFALLEPKYMHAVENMIIGNEERFCPENPNAALVMHVALLYVRGKILLDTESGLFAQVFVKMPDLWRGQALAFVGKTISTQDVQTDAMSRLRLLWEWRCNECRQGQPAYEHYHEMSSFGWWWISEKFPEDWALDNLESVLRMVHWAEPDDNVVAKLAEMALKDPCRTVRLLVEMCSGLRVRYHYRYIPWVKHAREIIIAARESGNEEAKRCARELVSRLRFWDYGGFDDLVG